MLGYNYNPNVQVCVSSKYPSDYNTRTYCSYGDLLDENKAGTMVPDLKVMLQYPEDSYDRIHSCIASHKFIYAGMLTEFIHFMFAVIYTNREDEINIKALLKEIIDSSIIKINDEEVDTKEFIRDLADDIHKRFEADYKKLIEED